MNILYASDDNYAELAGVSVLSLFENNKNVEEINIFILDSGISEVNKHNISSIAQAYDRKVSFLNNFDVEKSAGQKLSVSSRWSVTAYARLFLSKLLPEKIKKIIYIDCDTLILGSLLPLWNENVDDYVLGGVLVARKSISMKTYAMKKTEKWINTGVLLINMELWRKTNIEDKFVDFINLYCGNLISVDESVINGVLNGRIKPIKMKYNYMGLASRYFMRRTMVKRHYTQTDYDEAVKEPVIVHFMGSWMPRPWIDGDNNPVFQERYMEYRGQSPWGGSPLRKGRKKRGLKLTASQVLKALPEPVYFIYLDIRRNFNKKHFLYYLYARKCLRKSDIKLDDCRLGR
ncbi:MAG: glycosyltransferase family 8 protein [Lachnospiraceae bacterium]|nr:glycosyltransferase family 8 protein [Lachnospiraceae bacterium]